MIFKKILFLIICFLVTSENLFAQVDVYAPDLIPEVQVFTSPTSGSFTEGSNFEVPIIIDTKGNNINSVDIRINYDRNKFSIVGPSGKTSIIGVWVEPPVYDNKSGTAKYVGVIPNGINTSSGVISSVTFKANTTGQGVISVSNDSTVLLNDGLGTKARVNTGRSLYSIIPKASNPVKIFSETHPFQSDWYNNINPVFAWEKESGVSNFSYELNTLPGTIPDNEPETSDTSIQYKDLSDGIWYFHIKSNKNNAWSNPSSFLVKIDSNQPAQFTPTVDYVFEDKTDIKRALVSFFTTDNLSGIAKYEIGIIDKKQPTTVSPIFIESESPFQIPLSNDSELKVIVRAYDEAGNIRESSVNVKTPLFIQSFINNYSNQIIIGILALLLVLILIHYIFKHRFIKHFKKAVDAFQEEDEPLKNNISNTNNSSNNNTDSNQNYFS